MKNGWWYGVDNDRNDGWIPSNYVQRLKDKDRRTKDGVKFVYGNNYNDTNLDKYLNYSLPPEIVPMVIANMVTNDNDDSDDNYSDNANHHKITATAE